MQRTPWGAVWAMLLVVFVIGSTATTAQEAPMVLQRIPGAPVVDGAVAAHDARVVWFGTSEDASVIELYISDIVDGTARRLTTVAGGDDRPDVDSIAFDGRWVVWADDRAGSFDVYAVDIETGALRQVAGHPDDEVTVAVDDGMAVWARISDVEAADLGAGTRWTARANAGPSSAPTIGGGVVLWSETAPDARFIAARAARPDAPDPIRLPHAGDAADLRPSTDGTLAVFAAAVFPAPGQRERAARAVVRLVALDPGLAAGDPTSMDSATAINVTQPGFLRRPTVAGVRVMWEVLDPDGAAALRIADMRDGTVAGIAAPVVRAALTPTHLVVVRGNQEAGTLEGLEFVGLTPSASDPGLPSWVLPAVAVLFILLGLGWGFWRRLPGAK